MYSKSEHSKEIIINFVLDEIFRMTQIDPTWVQPEHNFQYDLEIKPEEVMTIGRLVGRKLAMNLSLDKEAKFALVKTPRELVDVLTGYLITSENLAA